MRMPPDLQLLPPDKKREPDNSIIVTHLETLMLLTATREGRERMRAVNVYPIIRECHLYVDDDDVREACDRLVQVLLRAEGEETEGNSKELAEADIQQEEEEEDQRIEELF